MNAIKNKILIVSGKGGKPIAFQKANRDIILYKGVGKSSICAGLSMGLAQLCGKNKVLIISY